MSLLPCMQHSIHSLRPRGRIFRRRCRDSPLLRGQLLLRPCPPRLLPRRAFWRDANVPERRGADRRRLPTTHAASASTSPTSASPAGRRSRRKHACQRCLCSCLCSPRRQKANFSRECQGSRVACWSVSERIRRHHVTSLAFNNTDACHASTLEPEAQDRRVWPTQTHATSPSPLEGCYPARLMYSAPPHTHSTIIRDISPKRRHFGGAKARDPVGGRSTSHLRQNEFWRAAVRATKRRHPDATFPAPRHTSRHQTAISAPSRQWRSLSTARSPRRGRLPRNAEHLRSRRPRVLGKNRRGDSCSSASRASRVPVSGATCDAGARHPPQRARRPPRPSCARSLPLARSRWRRRWHAPWHAPS